MFLQNFMHKKIIATTLLLLTGFTLLAQAATVPKTVTSANNLTAV